MDSPTASPQTFQDSPAHVDPSISSGTSPPPTKTVNITTNPRSWYLERKGKFTPAGGDALKLYIVDEIASEVGCTEADAEKMHRADLVRIVDHLEIPRLVGSHVMPGSYGIAYRCQQARRAEDCDDPVWIDPVTNEALPLQEGEVWRVKLLRGEWATLVTTGEGHPLFKPWTEQPKYMSRRGAQAATLFIPTAINPDAYRSATVLYITEGEKKAIHLAARGLPAVSIPGVANWSYRPDQTRNALRSGKTAASLDPFLLATVKEFGVEQVVICFDSPDIYDNAQVIRQLAAFGVELQAHGEEVSYLLLPRPTLGSKHGVDDWLRANPKCDLREHIVGLENAPDVLEALDDRTEGLLRIYYERSRVRQQRGQLGKASPEAEVHDVIRKLRLQGEAQVLDLLKKLVTGRLEHATPQLWSYLDANYRYAHHGSGSVYRIATVGRLTTYELLPDSDTTPLQLEIYRWGEEHLDMHLAPRVVRDVEQKWKMRQKPVDPTTFLPCGLPTSSDHVFQALHEPQEGPMTAWEEFLSRVDRRAFLTWLGSVLHVRNRDRRVLWLEGKGADGKSVVAQVLARGFGKAGAKLPEYIDPQNKHLSSTLEGCRFAYVPETKQPALLQTGIVRSISGGDDLTIDRKGRQQYVVPNYVRLLVCCNAEPQITNVRRRRGRSSGVSG